MSKLLTPGPGRIVLQICAMTAVAALMSGCSADSNRFGDAFGNPFSTGSIQKPKKVVHKSAPVGTGRTPPVTASALPPAGHVAFAAPVRAAPLAVSRETTGSIPTARTVPGASFGGWTGQGGASVQVGEGDSAAVLAQRYGVPENVLLQTNGLHAASEVRPGTTIVIPIYNAVASAPGAARVAQAPVRSEPVEPEEHTAPVRTVPAHVARAEPARAEPAEAPAEPARKPAAVPFKVEHPATLAERNAEAQRIVATQRAADKAAAEKLAVAQKAAEAQKLAEARKAAAAEKVAAAEKARADAAAHKAAAKAAPKADPKVAAAARAEAAKVAAAEKAAAAQKLAADREAARAKAEAAKTAAAAAKAAKVAAAAPVAKAEPAPAADKKVDATPTASVPSASAAAAPAAPAAPAAVADAGGPEFRWPAHGRIIGGFKTGGNDGINIAVPEGTAVKAAEGGTVAYAGNELKGYGNMVLIRHPNGYVTAYANNGDIEVKKGDKVSRGQVIAKSGQSGDVASPQLHFEVRKGSTPVDPTTFLAGT